MTKVKSLSLALIASAVLASPALAAGSSVVSRHNTARAYTSAAASGVCTRAPRVGAFATAPWTDEAPCEPNTSF
jgi:hypothetical protein